MSRLLVINPNPSAAVLVLGGAGMATHRRPIAEALGVPVVEPSQQAVAAAVAARWLRDQEPGWTP